MEILTNGNRITIEGNIKSINDFQKIKTSLDELSTTVHAIELFINDSLSITSSVIGYFNKLVLKDKIDLHLHVGNEMLYSLLEDLNLITMLKVQKIS